MKHIRIMRLLVLGILCTLLLQSAGVQLATADDGLLGGAELDVKTEEDGAVCDYVYTLENGDEIKVGTEDAEFIPQAELEKWDGESSISILADGVSISTEPVVTEDKITAEAVTADGNYSLEFKMEEDVKSGETGRFSYDVIFAEIPKETTFTFTINYKELTAFYQPPLTDEFKVGDELLSGLRVSEVTETTVLDENGDIAVYRPEELVGAYAFYGDNIGNYQYLGGENYGNGLAFYLYRPKLIDTNGEEIWATQTLKDNVLTVTVDQAWMEKATYPVRLDPTFGNTNHSGSTYTKASGAWESSTPSYYMQAGAGVSMTFYGNGSGGSRTVKMALGTNSNPDTVVACTNNITVTTTLQEWTATFTSQPTLTYQLASLYINTDGNVALRYDSGANPSRTNSSSMVCPVQITNSNQAFNYIFDIYASYIPASVAGVTQIPLTSGSGSWPVPLNVSSMKVLVIGGGGGGGGAANVVNYVGGGGGAGGYSYTASYSTTPGQDIAYVVGSKGGGGSGSNAGTNGGYSSFGSVYVSGGGGGGGGCSTCGQCAGKDGGSGGGGAGRSTSPYENAGGSKNGSQGENGGQGWGAFASGDTAGGGGGGATHSGYQASDDVGGNGGAGYNASAVFGTGVGASGWFSGGGGGGSRSGTIGSGANGGGNGALSNANGGDATVANCGSGGGGAVSSGVGARNGGAGSDGIILLQYTLYSLNISSSSGGTVTTPGIGVFNQTAGTTVTLQASNNSCYYFVNWSGNTGTMNTTTNPSATITMNGNYSIQANFALYQYTLTYTAGANGSVIGSSPQTVNCGTNGTAVTAYPNNGYSFVNWSDSSTQNPRTDTNVQANISVTANFVYTCVISITNTPSGWVLNGITKNSRISPNTIYYANPLGDNLSPSATVQSNQCYFNVTVADGTCAVDLTVTWSNFSSGDAVMDNSNDGTNGATTFGAYSWYNGMTYANKVIAKSAGSNILYSNLSSGASLLWGAEVKTRTNTFTGGNSSTSTIIITATLH